MITESALGSGQHPILVHASKARNVHQDRNKPIVNHMNIQTRELRSRPIGLYIAATFMAYLVYRQPRVDVNIRVFYNCHAHNRMHAIHVLMGSLCKVIYLTLELLIEIVHIAHDCIQQIWLLLTWLLPYIEWSTRMLVALLTALSQTLSVDKALAILIGCIIFAPDIINFVTH
jgi:hypothetical protein